MKRRLLWLAAPIVAGHAGCIAFPATALALGLPAMVPLCGGGVGPLLPALSTLGLQLAAAFVLAGGACWMGTSRQDSARTKNSSAAPCARPRGARPR